MRVSGPSFIGKIPRGHLADHVSQPGGDLPTCVFRGLSHLLMELRVDDEEDMFDRTLFDYY
jgi:hypothetical protein